MITRHMNNSFSRGAKTEPQRIVKSGFGIIDEYFSAQVYIIFMTKFTSLYHYQYARVNRDASWLAAQKLEALCATLFVTLNLEIGPKFT